MRVLIVEDEAPGAEAVMTEIATRDPGSRSKIDFRHAAEFGDACRAISEDRFDLIVCDLLLLPPGLRLDGAQLFNKETGTTTRFSPLDWNRFVVEEGGVEIIRRIRSAPESRNRDTAVVVASWFDDLPGFRRILRMIDPDEEEMLVVVPKPATVEHVASRLPTYLQNQEQNLRQELDNFYGALLKHGRPTHSEIAEAKRHADRVRSLLKACRLRSARAALGYDTRGTTLTREETSAELRLKVNPARDTRLLVQMHQSDLNRFYRLEGLYEDWVALRDFALFNPNVPIDVELNVLPRYAIPESPHVLRLERYSSLSEGRGLVGTSDPTEIAQRLIERSLLVFLAHASEPIKATDVGWSISQRALREEAFRDLEHLLSQPYFEDGEYQWPTSGGPVAIEAELQRVVEQAAIRDRLRDIGATIQTAIGSADFDTDDVVVEVEQDDGARGYYFNGDLEIDVPRPGIYVPPVDRLEYVAFFALSPRLTLDCLDGRRIGVEQLHRRFDEAGVPIHVESGDPFESITRVLESDFPDATVILLAPVSEAYASEFLNAATRERWRALMGERQPKTILVLDHAVRQFAAEEVQALRSDGIELMYPSSSPDALDLTKMLDHVICAGHRTRYISLHRDATNRERTIREAAAEDFREQLEWLFELGYDGDLMSGSLSQRVGAGQFVISSTKSDKAALTSDLVAVVESYALTTNELSWSGVKRPSSSSPWHALIYQNDPEARCILHTHWKRLTYSQNLNDFRTPRYVPTGHPAEAADVVYVLTETRDRHLLGGKFAILADHGEAFVGPDWDSVRETVEVALERADIVVPS